jgi:uncharacterized protein YggT (Ycf19 family)
MAMPAGLLHSVIWLFFTFIIVMVFAGFILSWIQLDSGNPIVRFINTILAPMRDPIDRRIPPLGFISISLLLVIWSVYFVESLILYALPVGW